MRIAFCHYASDPWGGSDFCLFELVTHLPHNNLTPVLMLRNGDPLASEYRTRGFEVHEFALTPPRRTPDLLKQAAFLAAYPPQVLRLTQALRRTHVDLVHVNTLNNVHGPVAAHLARKPLVWHVREIGRGTRLDRIMIGMAARLAARTVAMSRAIGESLAACSERLAVVEDGIDLKPYRDLPDKHSARRQCGFPLERPIVCCPGRIEHWKGQHVLIEAAATIAQDTPAALILIVGEAAVNKPEYLRALQQRVQELKLENTVTFAGRRRDIPLVLAASDAVVLPTSTAEPWGRTVVEAMAAGRPVVATAAGGPLETVVSGVTGWLVPPGNAQSLADRVSALLHDPTQAHAMGQAGRKRAFACYNIERVAAELTEVFAALHRQTRSTDS